MFCIIIETWLNKHNNNIKHSHSYDGILRSRSGGYLIPLFCHLFMMSDTNNQNSCIQKPCQSNQSGNPNTELEDRNPNLSERPVLYTGVLWIGVSQIMYLNNSFKINKQNNLIFFTIFATFDLVLLRLGYAWRLVIGGDHHGLLPVTYFHCHFFLIYHFDH